MLYPDQHVYMHINEATFAQLRGVNRQGDAQEAAQD